MPLSAGQKHRIPCFERRVKQAPIPKHLVSRAMQLGPALVWLRLWVGLPWSAIYGGQIFDSHKWPTVLVRKVKVNTRIFKASF